MPLSTPILQIIDRDPISLDVKQKVSDAAHALSTERFHHLPIVDGRRLVGMLSATDLLRLNTSMTGDPDTVTPDFIDRHYRLEDVMQKDLITVSDRATVGDAAKALSAGGFHAVPVVDAREHLVGLVTTTDLVAHMLEAPPQAMPAAAEQRLQLLERVYQAAQHYLHSGMGAQEHTRLERAIEAVRAAG
jgi:CBS domain-containing protein